MLKEKNVQVRNGEQVGVGSIPMKYLIATSYMNMIYHISFLPSTYTHKQSTET